MSTTSTAAPIGPLEVSINRGADHSRSIRLLRRGPDYYGSSNSNGKRRVLIRDMAYGQKFHVDQAIWTAKYMEGMEGCWEM
jgi:hypothetical protein